MPFVSASFYTEGHDLSFGGGCFITTWDSALNTNMTVLAWG
ncbi:MAG: hypothetical protein ACLU4J_08670 [Butyricimonas paravirosa]